MYNKNLFICSQFILIIVLMIIVRENGVNAAKAELDISQLAQKIEENNGSIIEWSLYARESVYQPSGEEWLAQKQLFESDFPEFNWELLSEQGVNSLIGYLNHGKFSETIQMITTDKNRQTSSYILYEVKGEDWNQDIENKVSAQAIARMAMVFDKQPIIFSCIKGEFNQEFDDFLLSPLDQLLLSLQAKEAGETLKEQEFYATSLYSSLFTQTLSFTNQQMNMQIGLRKNGSESRTSFVVGTPILIIEY